MRSTSIAALAFSDPQNIHASVARLNRSEQLRTEQLLVADNGQTYLLDDIANLSDNAFATNPDLNRISFPRKNAAAVNLREMSLALQRKDEEFLKSLLHNRALSEAIGKLNLDDFPLLKLDDVPTCGIGLTGMVFPLIDIEEHSFESDALDEWLYKYKHTNCPMDRAELSAGKMLPNLALEDLLWVNWAQRQALRPTADKELADTLDNESKDILIKCNRRLVALQQQKRNLSGAANEYNNIIRSNPYLQNEDLGSLNRLEADLRMTRERTERTTGFLKNTFNSMISVGVWGGIAALLFLPTLSALPPLGLVVGALLIGSLAVGIIGTVVNRVVRNSQLASLDNQLEAVHRLKNNLRQRDVSSEVVNGNQQRIDSILAKRMAWEEMGRNNVAAPPVPRPVVNDKPSFGSIFRKPEYNLNQDFQPIRFESPRP